MSVYGNCRTDASVKLPIRIPICVVDQRSPRCELAPIALFGVILLLLCYQMITALVTGNDYPLDNGL